MLLDPDILRLIGMVAMLLLTFVGAGLYLRGFYLYFRTTVWLRQQDQEPLRRQYKSSALLAIFKDPDLTELKRHIILAILGLPLFAIGGALFNALRP